MIIANNNNNGNNDDENHEMILKKRVSKYILDWIINNLFIYQIKNSF